MSETLLGRHDDTLDQDLQASVKGLAMPVALSDILSGNGKYIFMHSQVLDLKGKPINPKEFKNSGDEIRHLFTPTGFLDDTWFHRTYWQYGTTFTSGWSSWYKAGSIFPAGRILVHQGSSVFGYGRKQDYYRWSTPLEYRIFKIKKVPETTGKGKQKYLYPSPVKLTYEWEKEIPFHVKAMALADTTLFIAGPPVFISEENAHKNIYEADTQKKLQQQLESLQGEKGGMIWSISSQTGEKLSGLKLNSIPVFDGMAIAYGKLYMAMEDGSIVCCGE